MSEYLNRFLFKRLRKRGLTQVGKYKLINLTLHKKKTHALSLRKLNLFSFFTEKSLPNKTLVLIYHLTETTKRTLDNSCDQEHIQDSLDGNQLFLTNGRTGE